MYSSAAHLSMSTRFFGVGEESVLESDIKSVTNTRWRQLIHPHAEVGPCFGEWLQSLGASLPGSRALLR